MFAGKVLTCFMSFLSPTPPSFSPGLETWKNSDLFFYVLWDFETYKKFRSLPLYKCPGTYFFIFLGLGFLHISTYFFIFSSYSWDLKKFLQSSCTHQCFMQYELVSLSSSSSPLLEIGTFPEYDRKKYVENMKKYVGWSSPSL